MHLSRGLSLLDLLVSLSLGSLLFGATLSMLVGEIKTEAVLREWRTLFRLGERIKLEQLRLTHNMDTHRLPISPVVHHRGEIRFRDGALHPITHSTGRLTPHPRSSALTTTHVNFPQTMRVASYEGGSQSGRFIVCPLAADWSEQNQQRSFIGVSLNGIVEMVGRVQGGNGRCRTLTASAPIRSMLSTTEPVTRLPFVRLVVPISALATLYVDTRGTLRYLSHLGEQTLENQPLADGVHTLRWYTEEVAPARWLRMHAVLANRHARLISLVSMNRLGRLPPWMLIANAR